MRMCSYSSKSKLESPHILKCWFCLVGTNILRQLIFFNLSFKLFLSCVTFFFLMLILITVVWAGKFLYLKVSGSLSAWLQ